MWTTHFAEAAVDVAPNSYPVSLRVWQSLGASQKLDRFN
jgi:hypothetical protein